jgi:imidazolonepropionase-like amidohydrolase
MRKTFFLMLAATVVAAASGMGQDLALEGGTVMTITQGTIENGTVVIQNGRITAVGQGATIPSGITVIDTSGKYVMPGLIDSHTHIGLDDINEATDPVTPQLWMKDVLVPDHDTIRTTLAGGVTTVKTMHGSANVIGGVNVTIKLKYDRLAEDMIIKEARQQLKMALGENPKRVYGGKGKTPATRLGITHLARKAFVEAQEYKDKWDKYDKGAEETNVLAPAIDLQMETLKMVLEKELSIDIHIYRAEEMVWFLNLVEELDVDALQISHCIDGYKVADLLAEAGISFGGWVDWWGYKEEAYDGCPQCFELMHEAGVNIVLNSDSADIGRYLYLEAAKVLKYNDLPELEVLKMITINPAIALELEDRIGSIEVGKDGDIAVFDKHPLDSTTKPVLTIVEGEVFYDYERDSVTARGSDQ